MATETVRTLRLDAIAGELLAADLRVWLKLDVQGHEARVLRGAAATLARVDAVELELPVSPQYEGHGSARRERAKTARDLLCERAEREMERVWPVFDEGLEAVNRDGDPDFRARVQAAAELLAQAHGKPVQPTRVRRVRCSL